MMLLPSHFIGFLALVASAAGSPAQLTPSNPVLKLNSAAAVQNTAKFGGAVQNDNGVTAVTGTFTVPALSQPPSGNNQSYYYVYIWAGIDGTGPANCHNQLFQAGVLTSYHSGVAEYYGFFKWYPDGAIVLAGAAFPVGVNDVVTATVRATSNSTGKATLMNRTNGKIISRTFTGEPALCAMYADWIVEAPTNGTGLPAFTPVTFTDASYITNSITKPLTSNATIYAVQDQNNGHIYTNCSIPGSGSVKCTYVP